MPTSSATLLAMFVCGVPSCGADTTQIGTETGATLEIDDRPDTLEAKRKREVARAQRPGISSKVAPLGVAQVEVRRLDARVETAVEELSRRGRLVREDLADDLSRTRLDVQRALSRLEELNEPPTEQASDGFDAALDDFERQVQALERDAIHRG